MKAQHQMWVPEELNRTMDSELLSRTLARFEALDPDIDVTGALDDVLRSMVSIFTVRGAGLLLLDERDALNYVAATDTPAEALEEAQDKVGHGPCVDALLHNSRVTSSDILDDPRWPELVPLLKDHPIRAVAGLPVRVDGTAVGALDLYKDHPHDWSDAELDALDACTPLLERLLHAAVVAHRQSTLAGQLQIALDRRVVIERAIGLTMGVDGVDAVEAFNRLRAIARSQRRRVADVAQELITTHEVNNN